MPRETFVAIPDVHIPFQDDVAVRAVFGFIESFQPDYIIQIGDLLDCYALSSWDKSAERRLLTFQDEVDLGVTFLADLRDMCPSATIIYCEGNHEHRLEKLRAAQSSSGMGSLRRTRLTELLRLKSMGVYHHSYHEYSAPFGKSLIFKHGDVARMHSGRSAHAQSDKAHRRDLCCGISGHTHRIGRYSVTRGGRSYWWIEAGHLATREVSREYCPDPPDWQQGIVVGFHDEFGPHAWCCPIHDGRLTLPSDAGL